MSSVPNCLDNIIGLSRSTCDCFDSGRPYDANESKSGRYLDETEGLNLNMTDAAADCEQGSVWDILSRARSNALLNFKTDLMARLVSIYKHRRKAFSGLMGGGDFKNSLTNQTGDYAGVQIACTNIIGGVMTIKRIGLVFDQTADFKIWIYDNVTESALIEYDVHANANALTWFDLPSPLSLDMNNFGNDNPRYWIVYPTGVYKPKDNRASCGCGGSHYKYYWNLEKPKFVSYEKYRWSEFVMFTGTTGSDITKDGRASWSTSQYLQGLLLDVDFKCKVQDLICTDAIDFDSNEVAATMAAAVQYKAAAFVIDNILASGNINRYTMTDKERLIGKKNTYQKEYADRVEWVAQKINVEANDCLVCDDFNDLIKIGILA
jgi:hypothetical protein